MSNSHPINIHILDKEYKISCPEGEQAALLESVGYLDKKMREVRDSGKIIGSERIAVITALNITHELLNSFQDNDQLGAELQPRLKNLENKISSALQKVRQMEI